MRSTRLVCFVLSSVVLAACGESDPTPESGTATGSSAGAGGGGGEGPGAGGTGGYPSAELHFFVHSPPGTEETETSTALIGDPLRVTLTGLPPAAEVTLRARIPGFESSGVFSAHDDGTVDLGEDAPLSGSYTGADPDGMLWSMLPSTSADDPEADPYAVRFSAELGAEVVAEAVFTRYGQIEGIDEIEVDEGGLVGSLALPPGPGPHPALILLGGSEGGIDWAKGASTYYASLGYASLGLAYFAVPGLPPYLTEIPLEYFGDALAWLEARPEIDPARIGVMGGSRGGELVLLLGATFPQIRAVVARVPSGVVWGAPKFGGGETSSWTLAADPVPWLPIDGATFQPTVEEDEAGHDVLSYRQAFLNAVAAATPEQVDAASPRVEDSPAAFLMIAGADDQIWPSCELATIAMDRLEASGHTAAHDDELVCYPDAGHFIGVPGQPTTGISSTQHPITQQWLAIGGEPAGIAHASRDANTRLRVFLDALLKPKP